MQGELASERVLIVVGAKEDREADRSSEGIDNQKVERREDRACSLARQINRTRDQKRDAHNIQKRKHRDGNCFPCPFHHVWLSYQFPQIIVRWRTKRPCVDKWNPLV